MNDEIWGVAYVNYIGEQRLQYARRLNKMKSETRFMLELHKRTHRLYLPILLQVVLRPLFWYSHYQRS